MCVNLAVVSNLLGFHVGVGVDFRVVCKPLVLRLACHLHAFLDILRRLPGCLIGEFGIFYRWHFNLDVNPIQQRAGDARDIALDLVLCAFAVSARVAEETARAGVHGGDEHEIRGIREGCGRSRDSDVSIFQRLPHDLQHVSAEFREFV